MNYKDEVNRSLGTIFEMLMDRGISGVAQAIEKYSSNEVSSILHSKQTFCIDIPEEIRIVFDIGSKVRINDIKKLIEEEEFKLYIIVTREKLGANDQKKMNELKVEFQLFDMKELQFNISKHMLVPKHELVTDESEIEKVVSAHMLKSRHQMPIILKMDPMARYLNAKPGNLVRVTRYSPTSGEHIVYRCCM